MAKEKVEVVMDTVKACKSCVRFGADEKGSAEVASSIYLQNDAFAKIGEPKKIKITIEAAK